MKAPRTLALLGYPLSHSFSPEFFREKFQKEGLSGWEYRLLERENLSGLREEIQQEESWLGFNVTIPYKEKILPLLDSCDPAASRIGAVNVVKIMPDGSWKGFNSDYFGFLHSLLQWLPLHAWEGKKALIFGTGGSSRAVAAVLEDLSVSFQFVSRQEGPSCLSYAGLQAKMMQDSDLLVQCTPAGMYPKTAEMPPVPLDGFSSGQYAMDLIYNPAQTRFLQAASSAGGLIQNGLPMLRAQADKAWDIWNF
jgi:shikimate dehydrogenase